MTPSRAALVAVLLAASLAGAAPADDPAPTILHMLDYVAVDYAEAVRDGAVVDAGEYEEQVEFVFQARALLDRLPPRAARGRLVADADALLALVRARGPAADVSAAAQHLRRALIEAYDVPVAPRRAPDLRAAAAAYAAHCATCHGAEGRGDGPAGRALSPPPASFHDRERLAQRSVYGLYSTITLGVAGTGMTGHAALPEDERWGLAFFVANLGVPPAEVARGGDLWRAGTGKTVIGDLRAVAALTERQARERGGDEAALVLAYLRGRPDAVGEDALARSERLLRDSAAAYRDGRREAAQALATAAYLEGFELVEPGLDAVDRPLRLAVEKELGGYRALLRGDAPTEAVDAQARAIAALLDQARARLAPGRLPALAAFGGALLIVLREGLEALVVVAAIGALLVKTGRRDALPYVHAGWVGALALGAVTWVAASYAVSLSGATREATEGATALVASAILLYVGFWMHGKAYATRWEGFLRERLGTALSRRTTWALAALSFLAVYREAFETVLFAQALWQHAGPDRRGAVLGGFGAAAALLALLGWLIVRGGLRLPLRAFFGATSAVLAALAVVLAGKGIAALQEAGVVPVGPIEAPALPLVGLYPSAQGVALQAALLVVVAAGFFLTYRSARRAA